MPEPQGTAAQGSVTKTCPICALTNPSTAQHCDCGYDFATGQVVRPPVVWFMVGSIKFVVMSFVTFGVYEVYWFYKQWDVWRATTNEKINPLARAIFGLLFCYSLFKRVAESGRSVGLQPPAGLGSLYVAFLLLSVCAKLPNPFWLLTFFKCRAAGAGSASRHCRGPPSFAWRGRQYPHQGVQLVGRSFRWPACSPGGDWGLPS